MAHLASVQIVASRVACATGTQETWRDVAAWTADQLSRLFGQAVQVGYYDLFDPGCPALPPEARLPLVLVNGQVLSSGEKISIPKLRAHLEQLGLTRIDRQEL